MRRDAASERQVQAADPGQTTWLSANAGSGKTRVLIDRVARLLLGGTEPQRILCLTYTKAAASEMQNRLFRRLGQWAMLPEAELRAALADLGIEGDVNPETLRRARRLFARAIETPGGLKIQTIHSFCSGLLRRFPIEAGVSPNFSELDERAAKLLRAEIAEEMAAGEDVAAVDAVAPLIAGEDLARFLDRLCQNRHLFTLDLSRDMAFEIFGLTPGLDRASAIRAAFDGTEKALVARIAPVLRQHTKTMVELAELLCATDPDERPEEAFELLRGAFLYRSKAVFRAEAKFGTVPTSKAQADLGEDLEPLRALMSRVAGAQEHLYAMEAADKTHALHRFACAFLPRYAARKARSAVLDFDDLIARSAHLLSDGKVAAWVLYRLDGGIDHILVDEAQDTSPGQWTVIERLAEEFTSGEGARSALRTVFVVGDKKQSIYSFQGADLVAFDRIRDHFAKKFGQIGMPVVSMELEHSFRSADAVLRVVDLTFDERVNRGLGGAPRHIAHRQDLAGRVDLWPVVPMADWPEQEHWYDPVDLLPDQHHHVVLARRIAGEIRRMIDAGTVIPARDGAKTLDEGDILVLVQRRSDLFHEIIRACKDANLAIAGADRLKIGGELAVRDLTALLRILVTPEDDLSLAAALRSPIFGWSEAELYRLAQPRPEKTFLWSALRAAAVDHPATIEMLNDLRRQADFLRPFEMLERILTRHGARARLISRLGPEAEDGIDALLAQSLQFERAEVPSLTGFLNWLDADEVEIKRRLDTATRAIRVMTVHGAKGLEAPVVILPDTAVRKDDVKDEILRVGDRALWKTKSEASPRLIVDAREALRERQREERMRLLYVAMTRAEIWLIVCAAGDVGQGAGSWYAMVSDAVEKAGAVDLPLQDGTGRRHANGTWPTGMSGSGADDATEQAPLPDWTGAPARSAERQEQPLSPSKLGGAKALFGEDALDEGAARQKGIWLHLLLEHLPKWPRDVWPDIAAGLLSMEGEGPGSAMIEPLLKEVIGVVDAPDVQDLFAPSALVEVELTARLPELGDRLLHGTIDRLLVTEDSVRLVDFKSNAIVPERPEDVPEGILRQMGAYAAMLERIYPGRRIDSAILWTRTGRLMPLDAEIVRAALRSTTIP